MKKKKNLAEAQFFLDIIDLIDIHPELEGKNWSEIIELPVDGKLTCELKNHDLIGREPPFRKENSVWKIVFRKGTALLFRNKSCVRTYAMTKKIIVL